MIQPDRDGMVPCPCGAPRHFARPCAACAGPNPAVLPPPGLGASATPDARAEADAARTAASVPYRLTVGTVAVLPPRGPLVAERTYGPDETFEVAFRRSHSDRERGGS